MGLDFSHCNASWSYSGFNTFRRKLAAAVNLDWEVMTSNYHLDAKAKQQAWNEASTYGIFPLLRHSDNHGWLIPKECIRILTQLPQLINAWPSDDTDRIQATELIKGLRAAVTEGENLEFY